MTPSLRTVTSSENVCFCCLVYARARVWCVRKGRARVRLKHSVCMKSSPIAYVQFRHHAVMFSRGGAIYAENTNLNVTGSTFYNTSAVSYGFTGNYLTQGPHGLPASTAVLSVMRWLLDRQQLRLVTLGRPFAHAIHVSHHHPFVHPHTPLPTFSSHTGGAIDVVSSTQAIEVGIHGCTFERTRVMAPDDNDGKGGAVHVYSSVEVTVDISASNFTDSIVDTVGVRCLPLCLGVLVACAASFLPPPLQCHLLSFNTRSGRRCCPWWCGGGDVGRWCVGHASHRWRKRFFELPGV